MQNSCPLISQSCCIQSKVLPYDTLMLIRCSKCKTKIFRYRKIGKGRLWHCWLDRITEDNSVRKGNEVLCPCGNVIGRVDEKWIKMNQRAIVYSGSYIRK